jgi:hypothetical protein
MARGRRVHESPSGARVVRAFGEPRSVCGCDAGAYAERVVLYRLGMIKTKSALTAAAPCPWILNSVTRRTSPSALEHDYGSSRWLIAACVHLLISIVGDDSPCAQAR